MPANSQYDHIPLLAEETDEYLLEKKDLWDAKMGSDGNDALDNSALHNGYVPETKVQLYPETVTSSSHTNKYPKEIRKAVIALGLCAGGFLCNSVSIVLTHQKVPDRTLHPHLPDISLDNFTKQRWLNDVADILVIISSFSCLALVVLHRHRWILLRRVSFILSILYTMRSVTMYATVLPLANDHVYCSPKMNTTTSFGTTVWTVTEEVIKLVGAGGLPITGRKTMCGDYIFSGHTIIVMLAYLLIREYVPKRFALMHYASGVMAWIGMLCLLVSHGHYTIDVLIAYYATTRMFWMYHTFANNSQLRQKSSANSLSEVWWFPLFKYFEENVKGAVPKEYEIPRMKRSHTLTLNKNRRR